MGAFLRFVRRGIVLELIVAYLVALLVYRVASAVFAYVVEPLVALAFHVNALGDLRVPGRPGDPSTSSLQLGLLVGTVADMAVMLTVLAVAFTLLGEAGRREPVATCPECLSEIPAAARRCRYCGAGQAAAAETVGA